MATWHLLVNWPEWHILSHHQRVIRPNSDENRGYPHREKNTPVEEQPERRTADTDSGTPEIRSGVRASKHRSIKVNKTRLLT